MKARLWLRFAAAWRTHSFAVTVQIERSKESYVRITALQKGFRDAHSCSEHRAKFNRRYSLLRCFALSACFCVLGVSVAHGWQMHPVQQRPSDSPATVDTLAATLAAAIADSNESPVIVFDFAGPDEVTGASERSLADEFSSALARASNGFLVIDRAQIHDGLRAKNWTPSDLVDPHKAVAMAEELNARVYVWGAIAVGPDNIELTVDAFRVYAEKRIGGSTMTLPLTDQMKEAKGQRDAKDLESGSPQPGKDGYTFPACVYCPQAQYTQPAEWHRFSGNLTLSMLVTPDGRADDVVAIKALPYGLTEKAIETVRSWKFKPAQSPDGSPATVRQSVEMTFRITSLE
jgi:TonB family protein